MKKKTKSCHPSSKFDRISDLPLNVLDNILVRLPFRTAVRTSILSKSWRYKWVTLSSLEFGNHDFSFKFPNSEEEKVTLKKKMVNVIYGVLLRHHGHIDKFTIFPFVKVDSYDVDQCCFFLSTKNVKEFNLLVRVDLEYNYKLHSCLFSCQKLERLELIHCILELPLTFKGFNNLRSLVLKFISTRDEELGSLIQSCPVLEEVILSGIKGLSNLKIHAPKLKIVNIDCFFDDISVESSPVLEDTTICWSNKASAGQLKQRRMVSNLVRLLGGLSRLKRLIIWDRFIELLAVGEVPEKLPTSHNHLTYLNLGSLSFNNLEEIRVAFLILRSSPSLEKVHFWASKCTDPNDMKVQAISKFMDAQCQSDISFTQLRSITIFYSGVRAAMEFVKLVLARSPVLKTFFFYKDCDISNESIMEELLELDRASPRAKVKYTSLKG